jgi:hypothetical protein
VTSILLPVAHYLKSRQALSLMRQFPVCWRLEVVSAEAVNHLLCQTIKCNDRCYFEIIFVFLVSVSVQASLLVSSATAYFDGKNCVSAKHAFSWRFVMMLTCKACIFSFVLVKDTLSCTHSPNPT